MNHLLLLLTALFLTTRADSQATIVFSSGSEGYRTFRIPAIVEWRKGELLAFCEGRRTGSADFGDIDIVMKRSTDKGRSWSALQVIADVDSLQAGNPAPVVDRLDPAYPQGRLFLFYNTGNADEAAVARGRGLRECHYITSTDGGHTWSEPVNITGQVHRPNRPERNPAYVFPEDWRTYANTPGHALQFTEGPYRGRIYVAANHSAGPPQARFRHYASHGYFTDDHGNRFHLSETVPLPGSNEAMAAELPNGGLLLNARNQAGDIKARILAFSPDGGMRWDSSGYDRSLPDPVCQGSLLNLRQPRNSNWIAFCNPADTARRDRLTLRMSPDAGRSWPVRIPVDQDPDPNSKRDYTAYSDLVELDRRKIGVLYEKDDYRQIVFRAVRWQ